ncbi:hypothetical protein [Neobacillus sp. LXY-4]|uniref:hypothetical protein n=1 Tax=Neobacillus sp. LXY-4 TaxID=3379826 RepID=UPI003EE3541A
MLQNRINELKSGIVNIVDDKVQVWGFTREEMLLSHLEKEIGNWYSQGLYDFQSLEFHNIQDNALFIVRENGEEINRYQYKPVLRDLVKFKDEKGNNASLTFKIRKSTYSDHYHFLTEHTSLLFENKSELDQYLLDKYNYNHAY